jgi:hypothetical protein
MRYPTRAAAAAFSVAVVAISTAAASQPATSAREAATTPTLVRVVARDFAFDSSHSAPAGLVALRLVNLGHAIHMLGIARLDSGKTLGVLMHAFQTRAPIPWFSELGGPGPVSPGDSATSYLVLQPGAYSMICWWPDSTGKEHVQLGMMATFTISGEDAGAPAPPAPDVYVRETDYHIAMPDTLSAGPHVFRVDNDGPHAHDLVILRMLPGTTEPQVEAWIRKPTMSDAPAEALGGTVGQDRWGHTEFRTDLKPGSYLFLCMMRDATSPEPHFLRGMIRKVTVVRGG